jgi:NAD(P)H-hydrate epimerase
MIVVNSEEMRQIDNTTIEQVGIPGIVLMENAAKSVVNEMMKDKTIFNKKVLVVCGIGNNGGDGFAISRMLNHYSIDCDTIIIGNTDKLANDAKINYDIIKKLNANIIEINSSESFNEYENYFLNYDIIVDAIFGIGCNREIKNVYYDTINVINNSNKYIYSVDIPSGINSDNGKVMGVAIKANKTITFCLPKIGILIQPGATYCGELIITDIGIPKTVINSIKEFNIQAIENNIVRNIPKRSSISHKGSYGRVLIIAGSKNMTGAAILSSLSSYKTGCGIVKVLTEEESNISSIISQVPECIVETYNKNSGDFNRELVKINQSLEWADVLVIGPGMGNNKYTKQIVNHCLKIDDKKIIIDADGLNAICDDLKYLENSKSSIIITPHIGEMSRLTRCDSKLILQDSIGISEEFSKKYNVITILKSSKTIITLPEGKIFINTIGNNGMATAGSGDVLTGIIGSLLAQSNDSMLSAVLGVYIHSRAGDIASNAKGTYSLLARDIIDHIHNVMNEKELF